MEALMNEYKSNDVDAEAPSSEVDFVKNLGEYPKEHLAQNLPFFEFKIMIYTDILGKTYGIFTIVFLNNKNTFCPQNPVYINRKLRYSFQLFFSISSGRQFQFCK